MKTRLFTYLLLAIFTMSATAQTKSHDFLRIDGVNIVDGEGNPFFIKGTNLGNWLNPEGYMFGFAKTNSASMIDDLFCQLVGPVEAAAFWKEFKDNYITKADVDFIASQGANTIRLPFHYKLFTNEDYMGLTENQDGFARVDAVIEWCRANNLYLILDMHDAPAGQTGDNIDDSYGYPFLMESEPAQQQFIEIWQRIAERYRNEPVILGYELINEPIATYFGEKQDELNAKLVDLYKRTVKAVREIDTKHIILIGAPQWNSNFDPIDPADFADDPLIMYTCHRYGGPATADAIRSYIDFRDKSNRPMYMGEIGHNTDQWQSDFVKVMKENNIGYTFWPYKKLESSCMRGITPPEDWDYIKTLSEAPRDSYAKLRELKINYARARKALAALLENCKFENSYSNTSYIESLQMK